MILYSVQQLMDVFIPLNVNHSPNHRHMFSDQYFFLFFFYRTAFGMFLALNIR
ncbi:hypothetical protein IscW_ISCW003973 [Ixodes scapularis]|uniref:Uncharacterized protein n=1 Tax=Ixodes scapularis TaxID=6945 RepID=B7PFJ0_IXOSC|nr:hypothetical protein IscW_ISCW003973 [Ixodes scapularis]|eukprot:XP_002433962.1 hypothetical protein IscW_ISCW003973 [Ixodes scapularis]